MMDSLVASLECRNVVPATSQRALNPGEHSRIRHGQAKVRRISRVRNLQVTPGLMALLITLLITQRHACQVSFRLSGPACWSAVEVISHGEEVIDGGNIYD